MAKKIQIKDEPLEKQLWKSADKLRKDIPSFCKSAQIDEVRELDYVLTPGRYVGFADVEDDFDFNERLTSLKAEFGEQLEEVEYLSNRILENLAKIKMPEKVEEDSKSEVF